MSEFIELIKDVAKNPKDDILRSVVADWLEDHGGRPHQKARAEFIRSQLRPCESVTAGDPFNSCGLCVKCAREKQLLRIYGDEWVRYECPALEGEIWRDPDDVVDKYRLDWERGFVWRVSCCLDDWLADGPRIVRYAPVTFVSVDISPCNIGGTTYGWYNSDQIVYDRRGPIPTVLWSKLKGWDDSKYWDGRLYDGIGKADAALSDALIALAWESPVDGPPPDS